MTDVANEFDRLYRAAGGTQRDAVEGMREVFATYEQARVFASELTTMFSAERERSGQLSHALDELKLSELRFRSLVANSSDAVLVLGPTGSVTYASETTTRVWGTGPRICWAAGWLQP